MAWSRLDDSIAFHAKIVRAGNECTGAWVRMIAWSNSQLTDGHITQEVALQIARRKKIISRLIETDLLEQIPTGYLIHDFLKYQMSSQEVKERRERVGAARAQAGRAGAQKRWAQHGKPDGNDMANVSQTNGKPDGNLPSESVQDPVWQNMAIAIFENGKTMAPCTAHRDEEKQSIAKQGQPAFSTDQKIGVQDFGGFMVANGSQPPEPKWSKLLNTLAPFTQGELLQALAKARLEGKNGKVLPGLVLRIVERRRSEAPAAPMHPQPGSEWHASRQREAELMALEGGMVPRIPEPPVEVSPNGAEHARAIVDSLARKLSLEKT